MSTGGYWGDVAVGSPRAKRRQTIEDAFIPYVKGIFAKKPELRSALMAVAQYWADEADDAVHTTILFSARETPLWPHPCRWERETNDDEATTADALPPIDAHEVCSNCGEDLGWMGFDDNGEAIDAFQACCREDASQESTTSEGYLPYAVARRSASAKDGVDVEIIGGPVRAWLDDEALFPRAVKTRSYDATTTELFDLVYSARSDDAARQVLADHLQQKGDALGEYISLSYALLSTGSDEAKRLELHTRAAELEMRHGRSWLGAIAKVAPAEHVAFDRGFVRAVAVHFADEAVAKEVVNAREWGTVQRLRFLPGSEQRLSDAMTSLRFVGPLDAKGLAEVARLHASLTIERAHVALADDVMLHALAGLEAPSLRCLIVGTTPGGPGTTVRTGLNPFTGQDMQLPSPTTTADLSPTLLAPLFRAPWWKQLDELVIASIASDVVSGWLSHPKESRPKTMSFTGVSVAGMTSGFRLRVRGDVATVDMPSLNAEVTFAALGEMLRALPRDIRIEMISSRTYAPTDNDLAALAVAAKRPVVRSTSSIAD